MIVHVELTEAQARLVSAALRFTIEHGNYMPQQIAAMDRAKDEIDHKRKIIARLKRKLR